MKILVAMHKLAGGTTKALQYEDIVVTAFRLFPVEFALRGYPEYPDSSDLHKPLYGPLKRLGYVRSADKTFSLTPRGLEEATRLSHESGDKPQAEKNGDRMPRDKEREADRMLGTAAVQFCFAGQPAKVLDTDLYVFLGVTVRTTPTDFAGRMQTVEDVVSAAKRTAYPSADIARKLAKAWDAMKATHRKLIDLRVEANKRERK